MKTIRIECTSNSDCSTTTSRFKWYANLPPWPHFLRHHFLAGSDFALADRRTALAAKIIEDFFIWQDEKQSLADRRGGAAFFAIER
jgi:hypothetical protein